MLLNKNHVYIPLKDSILMLKKKLGPSFIIEPVGSLKTGTFFNGISDIILHCYHNDQLNKELANKIVNRLKKSFKNLNYKFENNNIIFSFLLDNLCCNFIVTNKQKTYEQDDLYELYFKEYQFLKLIYMFLKFLIRSEPNLKQKVSSVIILMLLVTYLQ